MRIAEKHWYDRNVRRAEERASHLDDIAELFYPELEKELKDCRVLDIGCGPGGLAIPLAGRVREIVGIDIAEAVVQKSREMAREQGMDNAAFEVKSIFDLECEKEYDVVLASDLIEHVVDQRRAVEIIVRCTNVGGIFYLTTNNRLWPIEGHYYLPFLSYLPKRLADRYVRISGRGGSYDDHYLLTYGQLTRILNGLPIEYGFKPPVRPVGRMQRFGKKLVEFSPFFWRVANAFQVVGKRVE